MTPPDNMLIGMLTYYGAFLTPAGLIGAMLLTAILSWSAEQRFVPILMKWLILLAGFFMATVSLYFQQYYGVHGSLATVFVLAGVVLLVITPFNHETPKYQRAQNAE